MPGDKDMDSSDAPTTLPAGKEPGAMAAGVAVQPPTNERKHLRSGDQRQNPILRQQQGQQHQHQQQQQRHVVAADNSRTEASVSGDTEEASREQPAAMTPSTAEALLPNALNDAAAQPDVQLNVQPNVQLHENRATQRQPQTTGATQSKRSGAKKTVEPQQDRPPHAVVPDDRQHVNEMEAAVPASPEKPLQLRIPPHSGHQDSLSGHESPPVSQIRQPAPQPCDEQTDRAPGPSVSHHATSVRHLNSAAAPFSPGVPRRHTSGDHLRPESSERAEPNANGSVRELVPSSSSHLILSRSWFE
jgi:hypothetical protein